MGLHGKLDGGDLADSLVYAVFETCTNCRRCVMHCPLGIDISMINTAARTMLVQEEKAPEMLLMLADMQMYRRENPESFKESFKEQFVDHVKQIREEFNDPSFDITFRKTSFHFRRSGSSSLSRVNRLKSKIL